MKRLNLQVNVLLAAMALCSLQPAFAALKPPQERPDPIYEVRQGDTLISLAAKYFASPDAVAELSKLNQIKDPYKIPVGKKLVFPRALLSFTLSQAHLTSFECADPILINGENKGLRLGAVVPQDALIQTPKQCEAGITLEDASVVNILPGTSLRIKTLRKNALEKSPEVEFELLAGRIALDVPKRQAGDAPYQVRTARSLAGVRGTQFRVGYDEQQQSQIEVKQGNVGARGADENKVLEVKDNSGLVVDASGGVGVVETLPGAPNYIGFEKQNQAVKLKFDAKSANAKYFLAQAKNVNFQANYQENNMGVIDVDAAGLSNRAVFYEWMPLSQSGLVGEAKHYGFCKSDVPKQSKCNVNFNMHGMQAVDMRLQRFNTERQVYEEVVNARFTVTKNDQFLLKDLPVGQYQWEIRYTVDGNISSRKAGVFDLVAIVAE